MDTLYSVRLLMLVVPLTTVSSIIKGYFMGKNELILTSTSSLIEECSRCLSTILLVGFFRYFSSAVKATFFILVMILGEIVQTDYLLLSSGKKYLRNGAKFSGFFCRENHVFPAVISVSAPLTLSRIVTSFTFMAEPMILSWVLLRHGYDRESITIEYGILSSYVMPLLLFPGFFSLAIANYLLPNLSSLIGKKQYESGENLFHRLLFLTIGIGLFFSAFFFFLGDRVLFFFYRIDVGKQAIRKLAFPFIIYYAETPVNIAMHALNQTKIAFRSSVVSSCFRILLLIVLAKYLGVFSVAISTLGSCYLDVLLNYLTVIRCFKRHNE